MAVRADNGQSRSYLVDSILGGRTTQTRFCAALSRSNLRRLALRAFRRRRARAQEGASAYAMRRHLAFARAQADAQHKFCGRKRTNLRIQMLSLRKDFKRRATTRR